LEEDNVTSMAKSGFRMSQQQNGLTSCVGLIFTTL